MIKLDFMFYSECPENDGWTTFSAFYLTSDHTMTYEDAQKYCKTYSGTLAYPAKLINEDLPVCLTAYQPA